ncbi:hypothetical protein [Ulvibacterium sp.]|uniref:hypothetical protein n=1 Tax=Ulvibacterium sp. TaxID=2665914 RepID=UPI003BA8920E
MRKILIPTDFSVWSLKLAEYAFGLYPEEIIDLLLVYPYKLELSDSEFYRFSPRRIIAELNSKEFKSAKNQLVNRFYININNIEMELFTGINSLAFQNFRDRHQIKTAVVPQKGFLDFSHSSAFDPLHLIQNNIKEVHSISVERNVPDSYL